MDAIVSWLAQIDWSAVVQIIIIDILLGGDNAVVIALACRNLDPKLRTKGVMLGAAGAIALRVILIFFAVTILKIPFLKFCGAILLLWIGIKLILPTEDDAHEIEGSKKLWGAFKTILIADVVMSLDNVIAIAGAAEQAPGSQQMALVIFGLIVSIPFILGGSQLILKAIDRFPIIIVAGGMLLGWIAGTLIAEDPGLAEYLPQLPTYRLEMGIACAALVLLVALGYKQLSKKS